MHAIQDSRKRQTAVPIGQSAGQELFSDICPLRPRSPTPPADGGGLRLYQHVTC